MYATHVPSQSRLVLHRTLEAIRSARDSIQGRTTSIGFVPTMGALHDGHASLLKEARRQNDVVFCSIFVNPTQFAPTDDLDKYPRQLEKDVALLDQLGVDHLFAPSDASTLYGPNHVTFVDPQGFENIAEGRARPGHFRGVATIVTKLFNLVQPTRAYFGQKDAAQCCLIRRIVQDLNMPVDVVIMDTVREPDGLAMSSRNAYLTPIERAKAPILFQALCAARDLWRSKVTTMSILHHSNDTTITTKTTTTSTSTQECSAVELQEAVIAVLKKEPLVSEIQYVTVDNRETMRPLDSVGIDGAVLSLAVKIGSVRLIDNIVLT